MSATQVSPPPTRSRRSDDRRGGLRRNNLKRKGVNPFAVASLLTGVLLFPVPFVALGLGGVALGQMQRTRQTGKTMAVAGVVLGAVGCLLWTAFWLMVLLTDNPNLIFYRLGL
jgi:hypothetical protein